MHSVDIVCSNLSFHAGDGGEGCKELPSCHEHEEVSFKNSFVCFNYLDSYYRIVPFAFILLIHVMKLVKKRN